MADTPGKMQADTPEQTPVQKPRHGLVKWVSSWNAGTRIAVGVVLALGVGSLNQQENAARAQSPGSSGPGLLPAATKDLMVAFALVLIVSGVVEWAGQRRGGPMQPSSPAASYADPRSEERLRHSDETVHREAHEMVNGATYCPSCGNASQQEDRFCRSCGAPSAHSPVPPSSLVVPDGTSQVVVNVVAVEPGVGRPFGSRTQRFVDHGRQLANATEPKTQEPKVVAEEAKLKRVQDEYPAVYEGCLSTTEALPIAPARHAAWLRELCKRVDAGSPPEAAAARIPLDWSGPETPEVRPKASRLAVGDPTAVEFPDVEADFPAQYDRACALMSALETAPTHRGAWLRELCQRVENGSPPDLAVARIPLDLR